MSVTIRKAVESDGRAVAGLALKLVRQHQHYDPKRFSEIADAEQMARFYGGQTKSADAAVLVAEIEGKVVGFAYLQFEETNYAALLKSAVWLHDIYIDEAARGLNAGKLLIEKCVEVAEEFGADKLMLVAASQNERAVEFFGRNGFKETMVEMMLDLTDEKSDLPNS